MVYTREKGMTIIVGVSKKSGKDKDYRRYLPLAKNIKDIEVELEKHLSKEDSEQTNHHKVINLLKKLLKNEKSKELQGAISGQI